MSPSSCIKDMNVSIPYKVVIEDPYRLQLPCYQAISTGYVENYIQDAQPQCILY